jgi:hypothetical protein
MNAPRASRIRTFAASVALAISSVLVWPSAAAAAPGQPEPSIAIRLTAVLATPFTLVVTVDAMCQPWSGGEAVIDVIVDQPLGVATFAAEGEGMTAVPCDGTSHAVAVSVEGGPFHAGDANAFAQIIAGASPAAQATDARKIVITTP